MTSLLDDWRHSAAKRGDWVLSSVRPVTLLIASGIVLISAILILTGLVAGRLRDQALVATRSELVRLDAVLAESVGRSFRGADLTLQSLADRLRPPPGETAAGFGAAMAAPEAKAVLASGLGGTSPFAAITVLNPDGAVLGSAGTWSPSAADTGAMVADLRAQSPGDRLAVMSIYDSPGGELIPVARRVADAAGGTPGYVVGFLQTADFESFFASIPLGPDGGISLVGDDGAVLEQYPPPAGLAGRAVTRVGPLLRFVDGAAHAAGGGDAQSEIEVTRNLPGFPLAVVVTRNADGALDDWAHQAMLLAALALLGAIGVAVMVYMIARQFRVHADLASVRAEKIEAEHARLVTEAELLKKERLSVLGQLTATVAHELRNPLSAIRNTLFSIREMTARDGLKLDRPIGRMERSIERCNRIIGDLLEYARTRELKRAPVQFERWLSEVLAEQAVPAPVTLAENFNAAEATLMIDGDRIRRVVINLVENAAQALVEMAPDGRERTITLHTRPLDDALELTIEDNGPGILPENRARIFEPLFSTKSFGTGLGLATVKQIVAQHDGTIDLDSEMGRGTRFIIRLPCKEKAEVSA